VSLSKRLLIGDDARRLASEPMRDADGVSPGQELRPDKRQDGASKICVGLGAHAYNPSVTTLER
jgi:hypothetical protein